MASDPSIEHAVALKSAVVASAAPALLHALVAAIALIGGVLQLTGVLPAPEGSATGGSFVVAVFAALTAAPGLLAIVRRNSPRIKGLLVVSGSVMVLVHGFLALTVLLSPLGSPGPTAAVVGALVFLCLSLSGMWALLVGLHPAIRPS
ncbi:MAG: hypothetical protein H7A21_07100 [Spirochaetales bacterium]|nr:hypothetical protein [Leptospiraceae bacterium]MCP5481180.1 hypothetical protein [Spirochaetales bacterium]